MAAKKRGPRPSSVVCPICKAPLNRACVDQRGGPGRGNSVATHSERRVAALVAAVDPHRKALASRSAATITLGNAVARCMRAGVDDATIMLVVRETLSSPYIVRPSHQVGEGREP
jgi:hypothetical protein